MHFRVKIATSVAELHTFEGAWRDLEAVSARSLCLRFDAARALVRAGEGSQTPLAILVESSRQRALVALARQKGRIAALGADLVDRVDPLATSPEALDALVHAVRDVTAGADLDIAPIRGDSSHLSFWRRLAPIGAAESERGKTASLRRIGFSHSLLLSRGTTPACSAHAASRALVRTLESRFPVRHRTVEPSNHAAAVAWMMNGPSKTTRRASRESRLLDDRTGAYLETLIEGAPHGSIAIRALEARDQVLAMVLGLEGGGVFTAHAFAISGELARYSPLLVCLYRAAGWLADRGMSELNLGRITGPPAWADVRRPMLGLLRGKTMNGILRYGAADLFDVAA
jgi:CelD/BcsL family acetyltransferase involved in cellulose biosynthesis